MTQISVVSWKEVYLAALFENDKTFIPKKISEAEHVIAMRRREVLEVAGSDTQERQALDNALFSLEALRTCLAIPPSPAA